MKKLILILIVLFTYNHAITSNNSNRASGLFRQIKCVVCSAQSIDESNSEMAINMKMLINKMIKLGKTDKEIKQYLVSRYGEEILFEPPVKDSTLFLWLFPFISLIIGSLFIYIFTSKSSVQQ